MSKMSSKDKDNKTLHDKLKQFFRINKGSYKSREDFILTHDIEKEISPDSPVHHRTKAIKELSDAVLNQQWEDKAAERLWSLVQDLLGKDVLREHRHLTLNFLRCLVQGQYFKLSALMRVKFFMVIKEGIPEDIGPRLELLQTLTEHGKDISHLEERMGPFLLDWMPTVTAGDGKRGTEFLSLLVNVIKFNSAYIDEDIVSGLVQYISHLCYYSNNTEVVSGCLEALDAIICYSNMQSDSLQTFIIALCRSVNVETYCQTSWKIMRNLLGTHMGHCALDTMCRLLQDVNFQRDVRLLRGAVFYINMGLWGPATHRIAKLECTQASVLPSFYQALQCNHPIVMYEVTLAIQRLVNKYGNELWNPTWRVILDIIEQVITHIESNNQPATKQVSTSLHEIITNIEHLLDTNNYNGCIQRFYNLVERCSKSRPEGSVLKLIEYRASTISPTYSQWQLKLVSLMEHYYKNDTRTTIRMKILDVLTNVIHINRSRYEDELIERIVVPYMQHIEIDPDITIRTVTVNLLIDLCLECDTKRCIELLDILEKMINKPFTSDTPVSMDADIKDVKTAVVGVIKIFTSKIYRLPSNHAICAYKILVNHLEQHYKDPSIFHDVSTPRNLIFECFLKIRANSVYHLGILDSSNAIRFSPYLVLEHGATERMSSAGGSNSPPPASPVPLQHLSCHITMMSLTHGCKTIISCIKQEKDWKVLHLILKELPQVMQNRALVLSRHSNDIDFFAAALCSMVSDKSLRLPDSLYNVPLKFTLSEFRVYVFPVLASLASYHAHLEPNLQQRLIKCLEVGLTAKCANQCVTSLTICTLEMRDTMNKLLPEVLLNLSKISATIYIAIPILEFLSTLTRLPKVFASFIGDQYMSIFAILLPYTNPFKYNHYTVSLAHHVIAVWFLKCRLPFRRDFVKFITTGLRANVIVPFEEGHLMKSDFGVVNEDSSNRKRSSSLTEQGSRGRRERPIIANRMIGESRAFDLKPPIDEALMSFHYELTETCIDLMARYTFSNYSARPKRLPAADFLLKEGQSMTWILGNRLITVTTSGCSNKAMRGGLCDNCWAACKPGFLLLDHTKTSHSNLQRTSSIETSKEDKLSRQSSGGHGSSNANTATNSPTEESKKYAEDSDSVKKEFLTEKTEKDQNEPSKLGQILNSDKQDGHVLCACWCQGWAEIYVRRPTGDMSWIMRIQNSTQFETSMDFPVHDIMALYMPNQYIISNKQQEVASEYSDDETEDVPNKSSNQSQSEHNVKPFTISSGPIAIPGSPARPSPSRQSSKDSLESLEEGEEDARRSRNPVRRSNSSPEMSANWKNPFLNKEKLNMQQQVDKDFISSDLEIKLDAELKKHSKNIYTKDMRVSCEAIPEEIFGMGTTPPSSENAGDHPVTLRSQRSYPGATQVTQTISATLSNTVPPSPTTVQAPGNYLGIQIRPAQIQTSITKAPQSPTQIYSRLSGLDYNQKQMPLTVENKPPIGRNHFADKQKDERPDPSTLPPLPIPFRDRGHTISVMSPVKKSREWDNMRRGNSPRMKDPPRTGINPSFVFLQLYHAAHFGTTTEKPLLVPQTTAIQRAVTNLDRIPPYETHKIGVLYVGRGQSSNEVEILANQHGSLRYTEFLKSLGTLIRLKDVDENIFLGGLDRNGENGDFAYIWQDDVTQVAFHVATLMPTKASDPKCTSKKTHIGNNYITLVYNESDEPYNIQTVKGQFNYACVVIQPLDHGTNQVTVQARIEELAEHIGHSDPKIISDQNLAILSRQLALHANLASMVWSSLKQNSHNPYASNWLERLRHIKRLRSRVLQEFVNNNSDTTSDELSPRSTNQQTTNKRVYMDDFTEYTT